MEIDSKSFYELFSEPEDTYRKEAKAIVRRHVFSTQDEPPRKKQKVSQDSVCNESQDFETEVDGRLIKIELVNFMSHAHFALTFNPKVNFIIGENGSGKSAILTAITVALGALARETGRGKTLKDLIKMGETSAVITVDLYNGKRRSYCRKGGTITVRRQINAASSSVKIKAEGKEIGKTMDFLHTMLRDMGIQINNPISVLDQNTARTFLSQSTPNAKYELFMRATAMEDIQEYHREIQRGIQEIEFLTAKKQKDMEKNRESHRKLIEKYEAAETLKGLEKNKKSLCEELLWAKVNECTNALREKTKVLDVKKEKLLDVEQAIGAVNKEEYYNNEIARLDDTVNKLSNKKRELEGKLKGEKNAVRELEQQLKQENEKLHKTQKAMATAAKFVRDYDDAIKKENRGEQQERAKKLRDRILSLTEEKENLERSLSPKDSETYGIRNEIVRLEDELRRKKLNRQQLEEKKNSIERQVRTLANDETNAAVYGEWVPALKMKLDAAMRRGELKKYPVGPLGMYVKVRDESWAPAIESVIGGWLTSFVVDNTEDLNRFKAILGEVCQGPRRPTITKTKFLDRVHDTTDGAVIARPYSNILDMLEISNSVVANLLIDKCSIERILLIPEERVCQDLFSVVRNVPRNSFFAITKALNTYYPAPCYRTYAGSGNTRVRYLKASKEAVIQSLERELTDVVHRKQEFDANLQNIETNLRTWRRKLTDTERYCWETSAKITKLSSEVNELRNQEEPEESMVAALRDEVKLKTEELEKTKEKEKTVKEAIKQLEQQKDNVSELIKKLLAEIHGIVAEKNKLEEEKERIEDTKRRWFQERDGRKSAVEKLSQEVAVLEMEVTSLKKELQETEEKAEQLDAAERELTGAEFRSMRTTRRKEADVRRDYTRIFKQIEAVEQSIGADINEVRRQFRRMRRKEEITEKQLMNFKSLTENLSRAMKLRDKMLAAMLKMNRVTVDSTFRRILKTRKYKGYLKFDNGKLEIVLGDSESRGDRTAGSLSGGEKSFYTMALLISLWYVTRLPFYFLDEFDVFMDVANRNIIVDLMMDYTRKRRYQFCFLTPLSTLTIQGGEDVSIHRLHPPRDSNQEPT